MSTSHRQPSGIRKAAVLVDSLERTTADAVLEQMDDQQARAVRQAVMDLGPVDPQERKRVIEEFFRVGPIRPRQAPAGIELDGRLADKLSGGSDTPAAHARATAPARHGNPFGFLKETEDEKIARVLRDERAQTVALVLAHLPKQQAGKVLIHFAPKTQAEVLRRLVDLEEIDPEVLGEVDQALRTRLSRLIPMQGQRAAGYSAVADIVKAAGQQVGTTIVENLATHDQQLAERFGPPELAFEDLTHMEDNALGEVIRATDAEVVLLALVGAPPELVSRVLRQVSQSEAVCIRHRLENLGPTRLSDVEQSRRQMADVARRLAAVGHIQLPKNTQSTVPLAA